MNDTNQRIKDTLTSDYWKWAYTEASSCPKDLLTALTLNLPHIDPKTWKKRLHFGGVFVNGRLTQANKKLVVPVRVEYYEPKFDIEDAPKLFPKFSFENIVYEDEHLLVYYKPYGIPTIPNREQRTYNVKVYIEEYLGNTVHLPSRLDTSTEGLVIMSKSKEMHSRLQRLFERRLMDKRYILEVSGAVDWDKTVVDAPIGYNPAHRVLRMVDHEKGLAATTHFTKLRYKQESNTTIIEAKPLTGRTHQIRVHSLECAGPIMGDSFYNGTPETNLHLLSYSLSFFHPLTNQAVSISAPVGLLPSWCKHCLRS